MTEPIPGARWLADAGESMHGPDADAAGGYNLRSIGVRAQLRAGPRHHVTRDVTQGKESAMPPPKGKDTTVEAKKCVETELKKFNGKVKKQCTELDKISADAAPILKKNEKDRTDDEVKQLNIMEVTRKTIQKMMIKEATSTEARINKMLKTMPPPEAKKEQKKLPLPGWISKNGLKLTDNLNLKGDVDFKKMKFKLEINGRF